MEYLDILEKFLEEKVNKNSKGEEANKEAEILDKITDIVSKLDPMLNNEEMISMLTNDIHKNDNVNSLTNLLQVQLNLSEKIHRLIN